MNPIYQNLVMIANIEDRLSAFFENIQDQEIKEIFGNIKSIKFTDGSLIKCNYNLANTNQGVHVLANEDDDEEETEDEYEEDEEDDDDEEEQDEDEKKDYLNDNERATQDAIYAKSIECFIEAGEKKLLENLKEKESDYIYNSFCNVIKYSSTDYNPNHNNMYILLSPSIYIGQLIRKNIKMNTGVITYVYERDDEFTIEIFINSNIYEIDIKKRGKSINDMLRENAKKELYDGGFCMDIAGEISKFIV